MIIYGSRMYGAKNIVYTHGQCEHCGNYVKQKSYDGRKWGHLYYIPLIPSDPVRVLQECSKCKMGKHVPIAEAANLFNQTRALVDQGIAAAGAKQEKFTIPNTTDEIHTAAFFADAVEVIMVSGYGDQIPTILHQLHDAGAYYEQAIAEGIYYELQGDSQQCLAKLEHAAQTRPEAPYPLVMLSTRAPDAESQLGYLERANQLLGGNDIGMMLEMTGPLEALKRYDDLVDMLDRCIRLEPELEQDKKFMKYPKKYAKKARKMSEAP